MNTFFSFRVNMTRGAKPILVLLITMMSISVQVLNNSTTLWLYDTKEMLVETLPTQINKIKFTYIIFLITFTN